MLQYLFVMPGTGQYFSIWWKMTADNFAIAFTYWTYFIEAETWNAKTTAIEAMSLKFCYYKQKDKYYLWKFQ